MAQKKTSIWERLQSGNLNRKQRKELVRRVYADDPGLEVVHRHVAGIDVGNESHYVAAPPGRDAQPVQEFGCWTAELVRMAEWLKSCGVQTVVMQSTGVYWIGVYDVLEKAGLKIWLTNARETKNLPGRKSDVQESPWLMKLHTYGLLRNSFRPPEQIRAVRTIWRLRDRNVRDAGREVQHMQKAMTTMNVQLANVLSDVAGVSGQAIIRAILARTAGPPGTCQAAGLSGEGQRGGSGAQSGRELARRHLVRIATSRGSIRFLPGANRQMRPAVREISGGVAECGEGPGEGAGGAGRGGGECAGSQPAAA
jgi:hypothetical protein